MNDMNDKPKFLDHKQVETRILVETPTYDWSKYLWPAMSYMILLFNIAIAINYLYDLYTLPSKEFDIAKHFTTVITMLLSYWATVQIYNTITRNSYDGRLE